MEISGLCLIFLAYVLVVPTGMHWELNHCVPLLCFVGHAELCDVVRLLLVPKQADSVLGWTCQQCPAVSAWQLAICVVILCSEQSSGRQWWRVAAVFISGPCNVVREFEPQTAAMGKWEHVEEKNRLSFFYRKGIKGWMSDGSKELLLDSVFSGEPNKGHFIPYSLGGSLAKENKGLIT